MKKRWFATLFGGAMLLLLPKMGQATTLTTVGDSINCGWLPGSQYVTPYGQYASSQLKMSFSLAGQPGNMVVPNEQYMERIFSDLITKKQTHIKNADVVVIFEGTNDYGRNSNLNTFKTRFTQDVKRIKALNKKAYIIGILPLNRWDKNAKGGYVSDNHAGYTLAELNNVERQVYRSLNIPYTSFDEMGYTLTKSGTADGLHPIQSSHQAMGKAFAKFLAKQIKPKTIDTNIIMAKKAPVYQDLAFVKQRGTVNSGRSYHVRKEYKHFNGKTYYSLYDASNQWVGYVDASNVKRSGLTTYHRYQRYGTVMKKGYKLYSDKTLKKTRQMSDRIDHSTFLAKGYYKATNGHRYVSLYDKNNQWQGYMNHDAFKLGKNKGGAGVKKNARIKIKKSGVRRWNNLNLTSSKGTWSKGKVYTTRYIYHHFNNEHYFSVYDKNNQWLGYINKSATQYVK